MKAKLIKSFSDESIGYMDFYKLSEPIKIGKSDICGEVIIKDDIENFKKFHPDTIVSCDNSDSVNIIVISDACTHYERLVFPVIKVRTSNGTKWINEILYRDIAGKHTPMTTGGNKNTLYKPEVYLRFLCKLNGLKWEGFNN